MLTNPNWNIHRDYEIGDVLIPDAVNQLVSSVPYDYVITREMLAWGYVNLADENHWINVANMLTKNGTSTIGMTPSYDLSIFIDCSGTSYFLDFSTISGTPWFPEGTKGTLHIYTTGNYVYKGRAGLTYLHSNSTNYPVLTSSSYNGGTLYIGFGVLFENVTWEPTSREPIIYEELFTGQYTLPESDYIIKRHWMTNDISTSAGGNGVVFIKYEEDEEGHADSNYNDIMAAFGDDKLPIVYMYDDGGFDDGYQTNLKYLYPIQRNPECCIVFIDLSNNGYHFIYNYIGHGWWSSHGFFDSTSPLFHHKPTLLIDLDMATMGTKVDLGYNLLCASYDAYLSFSQIRKLIIDGLVPLLVVHNYNVDVPTPAPVFRTTNCTYETNNSDDLSATKITWHLIYNDSQNRDRLITFQMFYQGDAPQNISWSYWQSYLSTP